MNLDYNSIEYDRNWKDYKFDRTYMPARFYKEEPPEEVLADLLKQVRSMNNTDLLGNYVELSSGDDYDGEFTDIGKRVYAMLDEEMQSRLNAIGWFD